MKQSNQITTRCFLGNLSADRHANHKRACRAAVTAIDGAAPLTRFYDGGEFEQWVGNLQRHEIAVVPDLRVLDERPTDQGRKPGVAYWLRMIELSATCLYIVDVEAGRTSRDGKRWLSHVFATCRRITNTRELDDEHMAKMKKGRRKKQKAEPGIVGKYAAKAFSDERARITEIWTSRAHANIDAAITAIGDVYPDLAGVSDATIERITEVGRTGRPSARAKKRGTLSDE